MLRPANGYVDDLPLLYDHVPLYEARRDVQFYLEEAKKCGGSVLEVGCGTGRILLPIARAGIRIDGLDSSPAMLERCKEKLSVESRATADLVHLHAGSASNFDVAKKFQLVTAPFRVAQHLIRIDEQLAFLTNAARHLDRGGKLIFDVFNPNFAALVAADGVEREDTPPTRLPDGRVFRRTTRVKRVRRVDQVSEIEITYYMVKEGGEDARLFIHSFDMRWYMRAELIHLVERGGFGVSAIYGDFDRSPLTDDSPDIIIVAERD